ncbi:MAG: dipeptide epimerase [Propionibacteriaceae bacterium]|jgi:L-alanine-DL-glutamate epimerase-like enolase superfamily enzyme|nr:dipeptide epimerase [Propionibacteriaceae bacterium]
MRITGVKAELVAVSLAKPFVISLGVIDSADIVFVKIETDEGLTGYGEGSAPAFVSGETSESILAAVELAKPILLGASPFAIAEIHRALDAVMVRNGSAKCAIDLALYDLMAKSADLPLYAYLGGTVNRVETDMTIGIGEPAAMAATAAELTAAGYRELKIKAGSDEEQDREAIRLIRAAAPSAHLKVDANQGWTVASALRMLAYYAQFSVGALEQPLPYWDIDGMAEVRARSTIPIMADESCFTPQDASRIVRARAADTINIKLMKCGGIFRALEINAIAEAANVTTMLGCMLESRLAIAAGAHLVAARRNFVFADLDSFRDFDDSAQIKSAFDFELPDIVLSQTPGIGVELAF